MNSVETGCLILHYRPIGNVIENTEARLRCQYKSTIKHLHFTYLYSTRDLLFILRTNRFTSFIRWTRSWWRKLNGDCKSYFGKSSGSEMKNVSDFEASHLKRVVKCSINFDCWNSISNFCKEIIKRIWKLNWKWDKIEEINARRVDLM